MAQKTTHPGARNSSPHPPKPNRRSSTSDTAAPASVCGVKITHPDRVLYRSIGLTKLALAQYYESIGKYIVPHVKDRPLTLVRCPQGVAEECFFMKHSKLWAPAPLRRVRIQEKSKL